MNIYCGIQLKLLSSLAFKLHNLELTGSSYIKQCHSEGRDHCRWLKPERISLLAGQEDGTFQGRVADPGMLLIFLVISTFSILPVACCLRVRIRQIEKCDFKSCSAHLCVCNQTFHMFNDQKRITLISFVSPLANGEEIKTSLTTLSLFHLFNDFLPELEEIPSPPRCLPLKLISHANI